MKNVIFILILSCTVLQIQSQTCSNFSDGFESGTYTPTWQDGTGTYTRTVTTVGPAVGNYAFELACTTSNAFYEGTHAIFSPSQPAYISWYMKTNTTNTANGYFVAGDANILSDNGIIFCYFNASSGLRFFNTSGYNHPIVANTWYHIEIKDINYVARHMDVYVNGALILTDWAFRSPSATNFDRVHLHSLTPSVATYDEVMFGYIAPVIDSAWTTPTTCNGDNDGNIDLFVTTASVNGSVQYLWSNSAATQDISGLTGGNYTITITDSVGCITTDSFMVYNPPAFNVSETTTDLDCNGDTTGNIDLTVTGATPGSGYSYNWSNGETTEDISNLSSDYYSVTITDSVGCTAVDSFLVDQPSAFNISVITTNVSCNGDSTANIDLTVTGATPGTGYIFNWSNSSSTEDISNLTAGNYSVNIIDSMGCSASDTFSITEPAPINISSITTDLNCFGDLSGEVALTVSGGTPSYSFLWNNGATTEDLSSIPADVYMVTVTDSLGCTEVETFSVNQPAPLSTSYLVTNDDGTTNGAIDLTVTGGTPLYSYTWSNSAITQDISGLSAGIYVVTILDNNGCTAIDTVTVASTSSVGFNAFGEMEIYPNPFQDVINIKLEKHASLTSHIYISDVHGAILASYVLNPDEYLKQIKFDKQLSAGIYILTLQQGENKTSVKLIKQ